MTEQGTRQQPKPADPVNEVTPPDQQTPVEPDGTPPAGIPAPAPGSAPSLAVIVAAVVTTLLILYLGLVPLADVVDRAAYAPDGIQPDGAELAWRCRDAIRAELRKSMGFPRRIIGALDPRPLLRGRTVRAYTVRAHRV